MTLDEIHLLPNPAHLHCLQQERHQAHAASWLGLQPPSAYFLAALLAFDDPDLQVPTPLDVYRIVILILFPVIFLFLFPFLFLFVVLVLVLIPLILLILVVTALILILILLLKGPQYAELVLELFILEAAVLPPATSAFQALLPLIAFVSAAA